MFLELLKFAISITAFIINDTMIIKLITFYEMQAYTIKCIIFLMSILFAYTQYHSD